MVDLFYYWGVCQRLKGQLRLASVDYANYQPVNGRILQINSALAPGGSERQVVNTTLGLHQRGYDVSVLCERLFDFDESDFYLPALLDHGILVENLSVNSQDTCKVAGDSLELEIFKNIPLALRKLVMAYYFQIRKICPEVVHIWQDQTSVVAGFACALLGVPRIILSSRNMIPKNFPYYNSLMRPMYRALHACPNISFINNSVAGANDYAKWLDFDPDAFTVIHNGFREEDFGCVSKDHSQQYRERVGISKTGIVVGSVFRFWPEKQPILWAEMAKSLLKLCPQLDLQFLLVGDGPVFSNLVDFANKNNLGNLLFLPGTDKQPEIPLSLMDIFVLTSKFEGTPNVILEAQYMGLPVVSTNSGGTADAIEVGTTGYIVDSNKPDDLANKVAEAICDSKWMKRAALRGPELVREKFGLERMVNKTLELYGLN